MYMGIGCEAFPAQRFAPAGLGARHPFPASAGPRGTSERPRRESTGVVVLARRRQPALEKAAGDFREQRMLRGNACFREEGDRIEGAQHRLPSLLKAGAQVVVLLQHASPASQAGLVGPFRGLCQIPEKSSIRQSVWPARVVAAQKASVCARRPPLSGGSLGFPAARDFEDRRQGHLPLNHSFNFGGPHAGTHEALAFRSLKLVIKSRHVCPLGHNSSKAALRRDCFIVNNRRVPHSSPVLA